MFRRTNPSVRFPVFAIELMWLFQVRFPLKVTPGYFVCVTVTRGWLSGCSCEG